MSYQVNYPELCLALEVPYDVAGSSVGVSKGNAALLEGVNRAIAAVQEDGSMDKSLRKLPLWLPAAPQPGGRRDRCRLII